MKTNVVTLKINDVDVSGRSDETVLQVARENNISIPTLCYLEGLSEIGACRLCLIEVKGQNKLQPACVTTVQEGMEVYTETESIQNYRRMIVEMLFAEGNHVCSVCVANGHCDLQWMAAHLGVDYVNIPYRYPRRTVDASHERFVLDQNRCILCTRCVRACDEIEGAHTWDVFGRGIQSHVITDLDTPWGESQSCTSCGKCVNVCPTGALFEKGSAVGEAVKRREFLEYLSVMRGGKK